MPALFENEVVVDSLRPFLLHETGRLDQLERAEREKDGGPKGARQLWDFRAELALEGERQKRPETQWSPATSARATRRP